MFRSLVVLLSAAAMLPLGLATPLGARSDTESIEAVNRCVCPMVYKPVCVGATTYGNSCLAECVGVKGGFSEGSCNSKDE